MKNTENLPSEPLHYQSYYPGKRFGSMVITHRVGTDKYGSILWAVHCDCGNDKVKTSSVLSPAKYCSSGCSLRVASVSAAFRSHGMCKHPGYRVWANMKDRCGNANTISYPRYGGRGISICKSWSDSFESFWSDMGPTWKKGLQLDRANNEGNYELSNCRWVTARVNVRNRGNAITPAWAFDKLEKNGILYATFRKRLLCGWSAEDACTTPPRQKPNSAK